jgi:TATA-binding protein-associated factor Taf7
MNMRIQTAQPIEPVSAPYKMSQYDYLYKHGFSQSFPDQVKQFRSRRLHEQEQIEFMEKSVQDNLGQHINIYA